MRLEFVIADRRRRFLVNFGLRLVSVLHQYVDVKFTPLLGYVQGDLYSLVIVLTRAAPALQYHFLLFFFFELGLLFTVV